MPNKSPDLTIDILPALVGESNNPSPLVFPRVQLLQGLFPLWNDITDLTEGIKVSLKSDVWNPQVAQHKDTECGGFFPPSCSAAHGGTLADGCRQCSRSLPEGSSVKRVKPDSWGFLMTILWFSVLRNSSTVVEPSNPTTCRTQGNKRTHGMKKRRCSWTIYLIWTEHVNKHQYNKHKFWNPQTVSSLFHYRRCRTIDYI